MGIVSLRKRSALESSAKALPEELAMVEKSGAVDTLETRHAEEALRHLGFQPSRTPE